MLDNRLPVAAVITEWRKNSHADVILGRLLEPERWGHKQPFRLKLVSIYADQFPDNDLCRALCARHGVPVFSTITEAVGIGTNEVPVAGVLLIGEHGDYPRNAIGQQLYPRRRLFEGVIHAFRVLGRRVPIFSDKHLSYDWLAARWMINLAEQEGVPLMAGSSVPVGRRVPEWNLERGTPLESALALGYGDLDAYGFHALEGLQCLAERRAGGETGVAAVRCRSGADAWNTIANSWPEPLLDALRGPLKTVKARNEPRPGRRDTLYEMEYVDGLSAAVLMLDSIGDFACAFRRRGADHPEATVFALQDEHPFSHFGYLLRAVERMFETGRPSYPVTRTLLTGGMLAAALESRAEGGTRIPTPHLAAIRYQPVDWPYAVGVFGAPA